MLLTVQEEPSAVHATSINTKVHEENAVRVPYSSCRCAFNAPVKTLVGTPSTRRKGCFVWRILESPICFVQVFPLESQ